MYLIDNTQLDHSRNTWCGLGEPRSQAGRIIPGTASDPKRALSAVVLCGFRPEYETPRGLWNHGRSSDVVQR